MPLEGKRINELTEVSKVDTSSKLVIDTGGAEALSITLKNLIDSSGVGSVDIATTEKAGIIKVGNNLTITEDGTLNAESGGGSGFDFEGTKAEFDAAVAAGTITDDNVSLITDDVSGDTVATKAELQAVDRSKADTNLGNLSTAGKDIASGLGMPSNRYIDLELGANSTNYTPPANGWFSLFVKSNNTTGWYGFSTPKLVVRNGPTSAKECTFFVPVRKGENCSLWYSGLTLEKTSASYLYFRFFYAEGAE